MTCVEELYDQQIHVNSDLGNENGSVSEGCGTKTGKTKLDHPESTESSSLT